MDKKTSVGLQLSLLATADRSHSTLCLHHCEVRLSCTLHGLAAYGTRLAKLRSCPAPRVVSAVLQISGPGVPGPPGMRTPHSPGKSVRGRLRGCQLQDWSQSSKDPMYAQG